MVEIFKTNVDEVSKANRILEMIQSEFPEYRINFDLADCDKILRVETCNGSVDINAVLEIAVIHSFEISHIAE